MVKRQIGVDFGTSTSVICYRDYEDNKPGSVEYIDFSGHPYVPTLVLNAGSITSKSGVEKRCDLQYGWDAYNARAFYSLLECNFKMDLISSDAGKRKHAETLTKRFFSFLFDAYNKGNVIQKGAEPDKISTYITYPGKFPESVRQFLKQAAESAGFQNVELINEAQATMRYVITHDTETTRHFFENHSGSKFKAMLIDMGAGTTDIAIFEYDVYDSENFTPIVYYPNDGNHNFGGSEIDALLCEFYKQKIGSHITTVLGKGDSALGDRALSADVKTFKETVISKCLKKNQTVDEGPGTLASMIWQMPDSSVTNIDRGIFEQLLQNYLPQFPALVNGALKESGLSGSDIDIVLLTGGHSQWYFVEEYLQSKTSLSIKPDAIISFPKPQLVVAEGAAEYEVMQKLPFVEPIIPEEKTDKYEQKFCHYVLCNNDCILNMFGCQTKNKDCSTYCTCDTVCTEYCFDCQAYCSDCSIDCGSDCGCDCFCRLDL